MQTLIEAGGRTIDITDTGEGPPLLFIPGSYSSVSAWRPMQRLLRPGFRLVTTSICGYGRSSDPRSLQDPGMHHEVQLVEALARHVGEPVHLIGHSFGATVALAAALARTMPVASMCFFEANPINIVRGHAGGELHARTLRMSQEFETAVFEGEPDAASRIIDFWGGAGVFAGMPDAVKAYCRATAPVNVLDWRCVFGFDITPQDCTSVDMPVMLVRGELANDAMKAITGVLRDALPSSRTAIVDGAGHFLISSHPADCVRLLESFLGDVLSTHPGAPVAHHLPLG